MVSKFRAIILQLILSESVYGLSLFRGRQSQFQLRQVPCVCPALSQCRGVGADMPSDEILLARQNQYKSFVTNVTASPRLRTASS